MSLNNLWSTPLFGITISIIGFMIGRKVNEKLKSPIFNPLLVGGLFVIGIISILDIDLEVYKIGGDMIKFFIAPATVALSIPLYKNIELLKKRFGSIILGILAGVVAGIFTVIGLGKFFGLDINIIKSLIPKSTTAAIGLSIAEYNEGIVELTAIFIVFTGILGTLIVDNVYRILKIEDKVAKGIALGSASHVMGTSKAMEQGEVEGAFASVGIPIAGIITVILAPVFIKLLL